MAPDLPPGQTLSRRQALAVAATWVGSALAPEKAMTAALKAALGQPR